VRTIYKYAVKIDASGKCVLTLPKYSTFLHVGQQDGEVFVWTKVNVNTGEELEDRILRVYGTGHPMNEVARQYYLGTAHLYNGALVFHVFEEGE
jgi:hypothetical protein